MVRIFLKIKASGNYVPKINGGGGEMKKMVFVILVMMMFVSPVFAQKDAPAHETHKVTRVVDGDTIVVDGNVKVRLIGVDTPEYHPSDKLRKDSFRSGKDVKTIIALGKKTAQITKKLIDGKRVRLEYDWERKDKYGRTLAYVYLPVTCPGEIAGLSIFKLVHGVEGVHFQPHDAEIFINKAIVQQGYGHAYTRFPFEYMEQFRGYEKEAREQQVGLWADNSLEGL